MARGSNIKRRFRLHLRRCRMPCSRIREPETRVQQEALVAASQDRTRLAYLRYRGGVDTQLNALDADRDLFQAELTLSQVKLSELVSVVQLYKALGGGWQ